MLKKTMLATIHHNTQSYEVDLAMPIDISIPMQSGDDNLTAWYLDAPQIAPVRDGDWIGSVKEGAAVNFKTITFNPHAHGTHTECVGHITADFHSINDVVTPFFCLAQICTVAPITSGMDLVIDKEQLVPFSEQLLSNEALIIRTLPNQKEKQYKKYSHTNWPYLTEAAAEFIQEAGIRHLLIDTPSVDKEKDEGKLLAHKAFWKYPKATRHEATITEFIFVPDTIPDGRYLLNLQIAPFVNDASPSRPVLYAIL